MARSFADTPSAGDWRVLKAPATLRPPLGERGAATKKTPPLTLHTAATQRGRHERRRSSSEEETKRRRWEAPPPAHQQRRAKYSVPLLFMMMPRHLPPPLQPSIASSALNKHLPLLAPPAAADRAISCHTPRVNAFGVWNALNPPRTAPSTFGLESSKNTTCWLFGVRRRLERRAAARLRRRPGERGHVASGESRAPLRRESRLAHPRPVVVRNLPPGAEQLLRQLLQLRHLSTGSAGGRRLGISS